MITLVASSLPEVVLTGLYLSIMKDDFDTIAILSLGSSLVATVSSIYVLTCKSHIGVDPLRRLSFKVYTQRCLFHVCSSLPCCGLVR